MSNLSKKLTWFIFIFMGWIILIINGVRSKKIHMSFIQELKELCKKHSKYTEDKDYEIVLRRKK